MTPRVPARLLAIPMTLLALAACQPVPGSTAAANSTDASSTATANSSDDSGTADRAAVAVDLEFDSSGAFATDPRKRVGYLTSLTIGSISAAADLTMGVPTTSGTSSPTTLKCVGVLNKVSMPNTKTIEITAYLSQANAVQLKTLQQSSKTTPKASFQFQGYNFDTQTKAYYLQLSSNAVLVGNLTPADNPELDVNMDGGVLVDGSKQLFYKVTFGVAATGKQSIQLANSGSTKATALPWGS